MLFRMNPRENFSGLGGYWLAQRQVLLSCRIGIAAAEAEHKGFSPGLNPAG